MTGRDHSQYVAELAAIDAPRDANRASDFDDVRTNLLRPHLAQAVAQEKRHRDIAREIRQRIDSAQAMLERYADHVPTTLVGVQTRDSDVELAKDDKRSYSQMLGVLKRACGGLCCPGDSNEFA